MGCNCGKGNTTTPARPKGWKVIKPDGSEVRYLSDVEAYAAASGFYTAVGRAVPADAVTPVFV